MTNHPTETNDCNPKNLIAQNESIVLAASDWYSIQAYTAQGKALPKSLVTWWKDIQRQDPTGVTLTQVLPLMTQMTKAYKNISDNCSYWDEKVYPKVVSLADDIVDCARINIMTFETLDKLSDGIGDDTPDSEKGEVHKKFLSGLTRLIEVVQDKAKKAEKVEIKIDTFLANMKTNAAMLRKIRTSSTNGYHRIVEKNKEIQAMITKLNSELANCDDLIKKNTTAIATTPTYAWLNFAVPLLPIGLIATGVVSGVALAEIDRIRRIIKEIQKKLSFLSSQENANTVLLIAFESAEAQMGRILETLLNTKRVVETVKGVWLSIAKDLQSVVERLKSAGPEEDSMRRAVDLGVAKDAWKDVKYKADLWRQNAYISIEEEPILGSKV